MLKKLKNKFSFLDHLFVFMLIIYSGAANNFIRSIETFEYLFGLIIPIVFSLYYVLYKKIKIKRKFIYVIIGFFIYNLMLTFKFETLHLRFFLIFIINFTIAYVTIFYFKEFFFLIYHKIIHQLCLISLFFWILLLIMPNVLINIFNTIDIFNYGDLSIESNILIYTINSGNVMDINKVSILGFEIIRNAGFAWEPGVFSAMIVLAIFINMFIYRFRITNNSPLIILILTLLTTFSTTGYACLILLILFFIHHQKMRYKILVMPLGFCLCIYLTTLSFMSEKIHNVSQQDTEMQIQNSIKYGFSYVPQRVTSLAIDFKDFLNNPILGYGGHQEEKWTNKLGAKISTVSGIGKLLAKYGLIGTIFFFIVLFKSSKMFSQIFNFKGRYWLVFLVLIIIFSYSLFENTILMCFWMLAFLFPNFFNEKNKNQLQKK